MKSKVERGSSKRVSPKADRVKPMRRKPCKGRALPEVIESRMEGNEPSQVRPKVDRVNSRQAELCNDINGPKDIKSSIGEERSSFTMP